MRTGENETLTIYDTGESDESHQPRTITNDLLSRQLAKTPPDVVSDAKDFYEILASDSVAFQRSAYRILHDHIPKAQDQISLDKALSKDYIALIPEELLSLILTAPGDQVLLKADFQRSLPAPLQGYLLSWKLVYDHWRGSSYAVQADYAGMLKDGTYLKGLLDFMFDYLITGRSRPVDASKFDILHFTPDQEETPEKELQHFLIHLYALSLTCVPNLTKSWWRDSTTRQTMLAVESWTEKCVRLTPFCHYHHTYGHSRSHLLSLPQNSAPSALGVRRKRTLINRYPSRFQYRHAKSRPLFL